MLSRHASPLLVLGVIACLAAPAGPATASLARTTSPRTTTICQQLGWTPVTTPGGGPQPRARPGRLPVRVLRVQLGPVHRPVRAARAGGQGPRGQRELVHRDQGAGPLERG